MFRVYDDRTNDTLFEDEDNFLCTLYIDSHYDDESEEWLHIWIEEDFWEKELWVTMRSGLEYIKENE